MRGHLGLRGSEGSPLAVPFILSLTFIPPSSPSSSSSQTRHPLPPPGPCAAPPGQLRPQGTPSPSLPQGRALCPSIHPSVCPQRNIQKRYFSLLGMEPPSRTREWKRFAWGVKGSHSAVTQEYCLGRVPAALSSKHLFFFHAPNRAERVATRRFVVLVPPGHGHCLARRAKVCAVTHSLPCLQEN